MELHVVLLQPKNTMISSYDEGILPKGPYLPCVSMAGRALLAGYHQWVWDFPLLRKDSHTIVFLSQWEFSYNFVSNSDPNSFLSWLVSSKIPIADISLLAHEGEIQRCPLFKIDKQISQHFCGQHFQKHFLERKEFYLDANFTEVYSLESDWQWNSIGSGNGLALMRQQAIAWSNVDPVRLHVCHHASMN